MSHSQSIKTRIHSLLVLACIAFAGMTTHGQAKANSGLFFADQHFNHLGHCWCKFDPDHRLPGDLRLGLQAQTGEIQLLKVSLGYYLTNNLYIKGAYHASKQDYESKYITSLCRDCDINFHGIWGGLGYELYHCWNKYHGGFVDFNLLYGLEIAPDANLFQEHDPVSLFNQALKPGIHAGWRYKNVAFSVGVNYTYWIYHTMTTDREPLYEAGTDRRISWEEDLFVGREGIGFSVGLKYFIKR